jgi:hypothetical protein
MPLRQEISREIGKDVVNEFLLWLFLSHQRLINSFGSTKGWKWCLLVDS